MGSAANEWWSRLLESDEVVAALLSWQRAAGRKLPWRETTDPYRIWVAETILQQTRVEQAEPYLKRFFERFPTLQALATSPLDAVLAVWQGLGYYHRAVHLHQTAQLVRERGGWEAYLTAKDPIAHLQTLPGIGPYTARALLSFSGRYGCLPVDGNVARVLSRLIGLAMPASERRKYQALADALPETWRSREVAFALMDLANRVCLPRKPRCRACPLERFCAAYRQGHPEAYPPRKARKARPLRAFRFFLYATPEAVWLEKRPERGLWSGLWCLPMEELPTLQSTPPDFVHELTHFRLAGYIERLLAPPPQAMPIPWETLPKHGMPTPLQRLLAHEAKGYRGPFPR